MILFSRLAQIVKGTKAFISIVRDPEQTGAVFELANGVHDPKFLEPLASHFRETTARATLVGGPELNNISLVELGAMPDGTLGKVFADHMTSLGLDPGFFPKHDLKDDHDYVRSHLYQTHDVWHVVTGFNTKVEGELGLQAFYLAQAPMPLPFLVLSAGLLNTMFFNFKNRVLVLDEIVRGWQLGRNAKPLFGTDWASMWDKPLTAVRADLGITVTNPLAAELKTATLAAAQ